MSIPDEQIAMMQSVTGASASDCAWYLRAANGDIDAACELLYAAPPEQGGAESQRRLPSPHQDHHDDIGQVTPQYASTLSGGADVWSVPPAARQPAAAQRSAPVSRSAPEAPMIDLEAQMRAAQAHLRRLGHTHLLPPEPAARDFGALDGLFAPPNYAASGTLRDACTRAARDNRWVIVNVLGEDFDSGCLNRDVWKNENVHQLVDCYYLLWQAPAGEEATQIASNYRLSSRGFYPPHVFIINPFTRAFVHDIPVKKIKGATKDGTGSFPLKPDKMIDALWKFFEETGLPQDTMQPKDGAARGTPPPAAVATPPPQQHPIEVVDEDDDAELLAALAASEAVAQPQAPTSTPPPTRDIDLTSLCVDPTTPESLRLRIKLPSGPWDLVLPKSLPVKDFADGIRTKLRALGNTSASALSLMVGFPPRKIYDETSGTPSVADLVLGGLTGLRSGDVVTPHF